MMNTLVLVPSRMASTRLPGKPLAEIGGVPMVVRVWEQAMKAGLGDVVIAAGDQEIVDAATAHGAKAVLTDANLPSGSDRIWQAVQRLMAEGMARPDIIINVQGDEPLMPPELITQCLDAFAKNPDADVVTFGHIITNPADLGDEAKVKIAIANLTDAGGRALYFSRCSIPHGAAKMVRHIGFYGYTYDALERFVAAPPSPLEMQEKLEQLRGVEMGMHYHVCLTHHEPIGVDTPQDLERVRTLWNKAHGG